MMLPIKGIGLNMLYNCQNCDRTRLTLKVCQNGGMQGVHIGELEVLGFLINQNAYTIALMKFGIIKWFDEYSRKHKILFEDGCVEICDMSKEDWEL
ncbi:hypothetical protein TSUD_293810, partial [Trifolium subterraneum]